MPRAGHNVWDNATDLSQGLVLCPSQFCKSLGLLYRPPYSLKSMPKEQLLDLVKTGDLGALQQVFTQVLQSQSVRVHDIGVRRDCLQISIESTQIPDQTQIIPLLKKAAGQFQFSDIHAIEVYGHTVGDELPHWMQQIDVVPQKDTFSDFQPLSTTAHPTPIEMDQGTALANGHFAALKEQLQAKSALHGMAAPSEAKHNPAVTKLIQDYEAGHREFQKCNFSEMELQGINLTLADLQESEFVWANLSQASLGHANLTSAKLRHANLSRANLQGTNLQGSDLQGANLSGANLSWANLRGVNFTGADLTDANLLNANLERVTMPDGTYLD
jgi:hypothetical protein